MISFFKNGAPFCTLILAKEFLHKETDDADVAELDGDDEGADPVHEEMLAAAGAEMDADTKNARDGEQDAGIPVPEKEEVSMEPVEQSGPGELSERKDPCTKQNVSVAN